MENQLVEQEVGAQVIQRVDSLLQAGFSMPADYNHVNAIKASMLVLNEMRDKKTNMPVLSVCSPASVLSALFEMVTKGLDVSKKQGNFIKRGDKLCFDDSYYGMIIQVKRIYPNFDPHPRVIYQGDVVEYDTDNKTGTRFLKKHEQKLENLDNDFVGAYMYVPCANGEQDLYVMTKEQIITAWSKSPDSNHTVHKLFTDKMVCKTIINSACTMIVNTTPNTSNAFSGNSKIGDDIGYTEAEDVEVVDVPVEVLQDEAQKPQEMQIMPPVQASTPKTDF